MQTCARHASSSDKIQLRSVTRIVPVPRNVSRDTTGWMEARLQSNHRHLEPRESRLELTDELFPIDRSWWNGLDARVWYQLSDVTIRGVALPVKSIKSKPWPAEMRSAIIHAFRPIRLDAHSGRLRVPRSSVDSADYWLVEGNGEQRI